MCLSGGSAQVRRVDRASLEALLQQPSPFAGLAVYFAPSGTDFGSEDGSSGQCRL